MEKPWNRDRDTAMKAQHYTNLVAKILSTYIMAVMTNYEIVDRTGLTHCAPMAEQVTPFKVTSFHCCHGIAHIVVIVSVFDNHWGIADYIRTGFTSTLWWHDVMHLCTWLFVGWLWGTVRGYMGGGCITPICVNVNSMRRHTFSS